MNSPHDPHNRTLRLTGVGHGAVRIRTDGGGAPLSVLERYRIVDLTPHDAAVDDSGITLDPDTSTVRLPRTGRDPVSIRVTADRIEVGLGDDEQLYGLGDASRDAVQRRGDRLDVWVRNVVSYAPTPFVMSSDGWGLFVNTTRRTRFDLGATDPHLLTISGAGADVDVVLLAGPSMPEVLEQYTALVGRPALLPLSAYGLTYVCHDQADARAMLDEALRMREHDIPCETIGLEPGWMETHYDYTTDKRWDPGRFHIPYWMLDPNRAANWGDGKAHTFFGALDRLHFRLSLWLCCDYDLSHEAERRAITPRVSARPTDGPGTSADDVEQDQHLRNVILADPVTKPDEPWFEHLKQFVDQGAAAFKLDGANQVMEHPDRLWGNGMRDDEMHNLYPVLLSQQMHEGFAEHTGRRPHIYTAAGYAGTAQYAATWAGDTGGGPRPLVSMLNHALSGHSNTSCDMDVFTREGIHFGFLQPWSQLCSWAYWRQPWLLGDELEPVFRSYAQLRQRLLPYLYSAAWTAHTTGLPMLRPMALAFPQDRATHDSTTQYMLGDAFLVGAFTDHVILPAGGWTDYWTGERHCGPDVIEVAAGNHGGALLVRDGSVVPSWANARSIAAPPSMINLDFYPGPDPTHYTLYEDDGTTLRHQQGEHALTRITARIADGLANLSIEPRQGSYDGMPEHRTFRVRIHAADTTTTVEATEDFDRRTPVRIVAPFSTHQFRNRSEP